jgi:hypothetical protein
MSNFITWFVVGILRFKSALMEVFWTYKLSFEIDILAFFGCGVVLGNF